MCVCYVSEPLCWTVLFSFELLYVSELLCWTIFLVFSAPARTGGQDRAFQF
jgi:hypothetical protein